MRTLLGDLCDRLAASASQLRASAPAFAPVSVQKPSTAAGRAWARSLRPQGVPPTFAGPRPFSRFSEAAVAQMLAASSPGASNVPQVPRELDPEAIALMDDDELAALSSEAFEAAMACAEEDDD